MRLVRGDYPPSYNGLVYGVLYPTQLYGSRGVIDIVWTIMPFCATPLLRPRLTSWTLLLELVP